MKKLTALFLVFSLMMLSVNLYAKERRGAELTITKKDGRQIDGELITVKPNSLLLLDAEGKDVSVDIADIRIIRIVKKSKALLGAGAGLFILGGIGALIGALREQDVDWTLNIGVLGAAAGLLIGGVAGAAVGKDKTLQFEMMTKPEIREFLDKLRKKARIRDYK